MKKILLLVLLISCVCSCQFDNHYRKKLTCAKALMKSHPDSAFFMLDSMEADKGRMSRKQRMECLLLKCNAQNKMDSLFSDDSLGLVLTEYYDRHGTPNQRMLAHYVLGCMYRDVQDVHLALKSFNNAVDAADTVSSDCDFYQLCLAYCQIGGLFKDCFLSDNALRALQQAEHFARMSNDTLTILSIWANMSKVYVHLGDIQTALVMAEKSADDFQAKGYRQQAATVRGQIIEWLSRDGQLEKAKQYMDDYEQHSGFFQENGEVMPGCESYYDKKATYYLLAGKLDSASYFFRKLQQADDDIENRHMVAWGLSQLYKKLGVSDSVAKYAFQDIVLMESYEQEKYKRVLLGMQSLYDYTRYQKQAVEIKEAAKKALNLRNGLNRVLIYVILVLVATSYYQKSRRLEHKLSEKEQEYVKRCQANENIQLKDRVSRQDEVIQTRTDEINNLKERLKEEERKQSEYDAKIYQLLDENKKLNLNIDAIREGQDKLVANITSTNKPDQDLPEVSADPEKLMIQILTLMREKACVRNMIEVAEGRTRLPSPEEWKETIAFVEQYVAKLPVIKVTYNLCDLEYRICVLVKLGMKTSHVQYLTGCSSSRLSNIRVRLLKKIFDVDGGAKDFDRYMQLHV